MESTPDQEAEGAAVIKVLAAVLDRLVSANSSLASLDPGVITRFHALKPPSISVLLYLQRVHKYASCSTECFILALIYIDRLIQRNNFLLSELNVHRVVITSIMLAAKFFDDQYFNNAYYAKVGGVPAHEMNSLEVEFLFRINFSLHVTPDLYFKYHSELVTHAVAADGSKTAGVMVGSVGGGVGGQGQGRMMPCMVPPSPEANPRPYHPQQQQQQQPYNHQAAYPSLHGGHAPPVPGHAPSGASAAWPPPAPPGQVHQQYASGGSPWANAPQPPSHLGMNNYHHTGAYHSGAAKGDAVIGPGGPWRGGGVVSVVDAAGGGNLPCQTAMEYGRMSGAVA